MLEIHLFVNPLGMQCYRCEQDVLRIDKDLQQTKLQYQFVPLINMHTIQNTLHRYGLSASHHQASIIKRPFFKVESGDATTYSNCKRPLLKMRDAIHRPWSKKLPAKSG